MRSHFYVKILFICNSRESHNASDQVLPLMLYQGVLHSMWQTVHTKSGSPNYMLDDRVPSESPHTYAHHQQVSVSISIDNFLIPRRSERKGEIWWEECKQPEKISSKVCRYPCFNHHLWTLAWFSPVVLWWAELQQCPRREQSPQTPALLRSSALQPSRFPQRPGWVWGCWRWSSRAPGSPHDLLPVYLHYPGNRHMVKINYKVMLIMLTHKYNSK